MPVLAAVIGDLRETTLEEIWKGKELQRIRDAHLRGAWDEVPLCSDCDKWKGLPNPFVKNYLRIGSKKWF